MTVTYRMEAQKQALEESKTPLQAIIAKAAQNEPALAALTDRRLELLAEAMLAGKAAPNTTKLDEEIAKARQLIAYDREQAAVATVAVRLVDGKIAAINADHSKILATIRQEAIDSLQPEFKKLLAEAAPLAAAVLGALSSYERGQIGRLNAALERLNLSLRQSGAIAWVQREYLNIDENWLTFHEVLRDIRQDVCPAIRKCGIDVPGWMWDGTPFDVDGFTGQFCQRLRAAGVNIAEKVSRPIVGIVGSHRAFL